MFISPLRRTTETAAPIVAAHADSSRRVADDLGEIYLGEWEGHGIHRRGAQRRPGAGPRLRRAALGPDPRQRAGDALRGAGAARGRGGRRRRRATASVVVAVTHSAVIAEFLPPDHRQRAVRLPAQHQRLAEPRRSGCRTAAGSCSRFNDTSHVHASEVIHPAEPRLRCVAASGATLSVIAPSQGRSRRRAGAGRRGEYRSAPACAVGTDRLEEDGDEQRGRPSRRQGRG